MGLIGILLF